MRWAETCGLCAGLLLIGHAFADAPTYGKAQTFEPGKKYNCVPTADHKGWDCSESGKAAQPRPAPAAAPAPAAPRPAETPPAQASAPVTPRPAAAAQETGALPSYLTNAAARGSAPPPVAEPQAASPTPPPASATAAKPAAAEEHPAASAESPPAPTQAKTVPPPAAQQPTRPPTPAAENTEASPAQEPERTKAAAAPKPLAPPAAETAPSPSAVSAQPSAHGPQPTAADFLALAGDQFVVELAHTRSASDLAAQRSALQLPRGKVYELHLRQNGIDSWLLVWGAFDSIEAARAARDELAGQGSITPGWPRRVAPLQAEARRTSE
jgi:hypothetical protein